ncbi:unnamed protein product, partial [Ectocarpus sp. 13 AM-2016]
TISSTKPGRDDPTPPAGRRRTVGTPREVAENSSEQRSPRHGAEDTPAASRTSLLRTTRRLLAPGPAAGIHAPESERPRSRRWLNRRSSAPGSETQEKAGETSTSAPSPVRAPLPVALEPCDVAGRRLSEPSAETETSLSES